MSSQPVPRCLRRVRGQGDDAGMVLIAVIMSMLMVTAFVTAGLAYAQSSQQQSRGDQDFNAAIAAAQAGVEDYIAQLNRNDNYPRLSPFNDCSNIALQGPAAPTPNSCGWGPTSPVGWQPINPGDPNGPAFHYDIDVSEINAQGVVDVRATGRSHLGGESRTIQAAVGRGGSTDFLYYTDHEDADPDNEISYPGTMSAACYAYWWGKAPDGAATTPRSSTSSSSGCSEITFIGGDVFDGPVHTNDTPLFSANSSGKLPEFKGGLQTADPKCKLSSRTPSSTWKNCDRTAKSANYGSSYPQYAKELYLPDNSSAFAAYPGCQYTGATRIIFSADGKMKVWSKETLTGSAACGGNSPNGVSVNVPNDQVIYVKTGPGEHQCAGKEIDGVLPLGDYTGSDTDLNYKYDENFTYPSMRCGKGNAFVEGTLKGRLTVATQNSVVVTGDLKLAGGTNGTDLMGLVAGNSVEVINPIIGQYDCATKAKRKVGGVTVEYCSKYGAPSNQTYPSGWPRDIAPVGPTKGIEINASIQTLQHSFTVQGYNRGTNQGQLTVVGSIAQKWRGAVGTNGGATGYFKDYRYDKRLKYSAPPYFPQFINAVWSSRATGELRPTYPG
ncbi:MAG: hypothetical protein JWN88_596 [Frankiales bacterium]|nr:hypothetical protein [Frankiales bacterium]